jgi:hypothetical protein
VLTRHHLAIAVVGVLTIATVISNCCEGNRFMRTGEEWRWRRRSASSWDCVWETGNERDLTQHQFQIYHLKQYQH